MYLELVIAYYLSDFYTKKLIGNSVRFLILLHHTLEERLKQAILNTIMEIFLLLDQVKYMVIIRSFL